MTLISMIPADGTVVIDGDTAGNVDFTGIDPSIHAIQWYGAVGEVEYIFVYSGPDSVKPPNEPITSLAPYQSYIDEAEEIIYAAQNPITVYSTSNATLFGGNMYTTGSPIVINTPNTSAPPQSTPLVPPTPQPFQELYWFDTYWVISPFLPSLPLDEAQANLTTQVLTSAATAATEQSRIYSSLQFSQAADPGTLPTADYVGFDLASYQDFLDAQVTAKQTVINNATSTEQLYDFDPFIEADPSA